MLGLAFKPGTSDVRMAPSLDLMEVLVAEGAEVTAFDPQANSLAREVLPPCANLVDNLASAVRGAQALLLLTEWPEIVDADWANMCRLMRAPKFVFDGRNALDHGEMMTLGFEYEAVGWGQLKLPANEEINLPEQPATFLQTR